MTARPLIPARMSFEDVARESERSMRRTVRQIRREAKTSLKPVRRETSYKGAEMNRLAEDWIASIMNPDDEMRWNLRRLRARSRELARNNPFCKAFLTSLNVNVLGPCGPKMQAQIRNNSGDLNKLFNGRVETAWDRWSRRPTTDRRLTLARFQHQLLRTVGRDGEVFVRKHVGFPGNEFGFALEAIDADQLDENLNAPRGDGKNEVRLGVEVDYYGGPVAYWFWSQPDRVNTMTPRVRVRVPAEEVVHLYDPDRVNQTRGIPWAATVMWPLKMLEGYMESEAVATRVGAAHMGFWTKKQGETAVGEIAPDPVTNSIIMDAAPGTFDFGPDGYELQSWNPNHPNTAYAAFVKAKLREVASGLGMSYNALANDLEGVNYSSMRSGMLIERDVWRCLHEWWISSFLCPIYEAWVDVAVLSGQLVLDSRDYRKFLDVKWSPRGWPWVDPQKDTTAAIMAIAAGLSSPQRELGQQGLDMETIYEEIAEAKKMAESYDLELKLDSNGGSAPATPDGDGGDGEPGDPYANGNGNGHGDGRLATLLRPRGRSR